MKCKSALEHLKVSEQILVKDIEEMEKRMTIDFNGGVNINNIGEYVKCEIDIMEAKKRLERIRKDISSMEK